MDIGCWNCGSALKMGEDAVRMDDWREVYCALKDELGWGCDCPEDNDGFGAEGYFGCYVGRDGRVKEWESRYF